MKVKINNEVLKFFEENSSIIYTDKNQKYMYYPHWIAVKNKMFGKEVEILNFDNLPKELLDIIKEERNGTS